MDSKKLEEAAEKYASGPEGSHDKSWTHDMLSKGFLAGATWATAEAEMHAQAADEYRELLKQCKAERDAALAEVKKLDDQDKEVTERMAYWRTKFFEGEATVKRLREALDTIYNHAVSAETEDRFKIGVAQQESFIALAADNGKDKDGFGDR